MAVIYGTSEADVMSGSEGNDELFGLESDDQIWGTAGADLLDGGEGFDSVDYRIMSSGVSVDIRQGLASVTKADGSIDTLVAIEKVVGSFLDDTLASSVSGVTLEGSGGDDVYIIGSEGVTIIEDERGGYDELRTSVNIQKMDPFLDKMTFTGTGDFKGYGNAEHNVIIAGAGNDWLWGGDGGDRFVGGEGFDTVSYTDSLEGVSIELSSMWGATGIAFGDTYSSIEAVQGSNFNDVIFAGAGAMVMDGADGFDAVDYSRSNDAVSIEFRDGKGFGSGDYAEGDTLINVEKVVGTNLDDHFTANSGGVTFEGGWGSDVYTINSEGVTIVETDSGMGFDELYTSLSVMKMDPFIEKMTYTGTADFTGYGNDSDNYIFGGSGDDLFYGGAGRDVFVGGAGMDIVSYEDSDTGVVATLWRIGQNGTADGDTHYGVEGLRGSHFNDELGANREDTILEGSSGDDTLNGNDGNDHLYGGLKSGLDGDVAQADKLFGGNGDDVIVSAANDLGTVADGGQGSDTITVHNGSAFGDDGFDVLTGTGNSYLLSGGSGNDVLNLNLTGQSGTGGIALGGMGDDTYIVNTTGLVSIQDEGWDINDTLILNTIANISQLNVTRIGDDAYLHGANDGSAGVPDNGVKLQGWYAGYNNIEHLQTADGQSYDLPATIDGFAMFG
ncbi:calcium-binding protein [Pseudomonas koreensis]|jgi:Ca2+-binding RTX toxin-like protein|uniref:calcium-binding protein n=1 Tax=Pseudomonas koreensis TaxID=198620 RepID=UPI00123A5589|nr:calcium-binding protein [Pseudomonas koreensis]KAA8744559.1 calcium-binding protein [Pseudomonas koreensis]